MLGDCIDGRGKLAMAFFLGGVVDMIVLFVGARSFFLGILEDATAFEFEGLDELQEFLVIGVGFTGEPSDEGGADRKAGNAGAHAIEEIADILTIGLAVHLLEHVVGDVLQWDVHVAGHFGALGNCLDEFVGPMRRVGVEEADPEVAFDGIERAKEGGEGFAFFRVYARGGIGTVSKALPTIHAKVGRVLRDEVDLLYALGDETLRFLDDRFLGAGAVLSADFWDDAERAGVIAALRDLDISHVLRREAEAGGGVVGDVARLFRDGVERAIVF